MINMTRSYSNKNFKEKLYSQNAKNKLEVDGKPARECVGQCTDARTHVRGDGRTTRKHNASACP